MALRKQSILTYESQEAEREKETEKDRKRDRQRGSD